LLITFATLIANQKRKHRGKFMINIFQMNPATSTAGLKLTGNTQAAGNAGESLFSILLNNLSVSAETGNRSSGSSLFTNTFPANTVIANNSAFSVTDSTGTFNKTGKQSDQNSVQSHDFLLPESAMPNLASFLEKKGFSTEQIDGILLSSLNDKGLIGIHKLVAAIQSAKTGTLSEKTGLVIEAASVPKVQELLFNMGLGVGEVRTTIEKASDQKGGLSLDMLAEALKEQTRGEVSKFELVSLFEQNNISMTPQTNDTAAVPGLKNSFAYNTRMSDAAQAVTDPQNNISGNPQANDTNKAAMELKKEFTNFVNGSSQDLEKTQNQNIAVPLREKYVQAHVMKSLKEALAADNSGSDLSKAVTQESAQETGPLNQVLSKGQTQWQKGNEGKIIDILNGEKTSGTLISDKKLFQEQIETVDEPAEFLTQGDQKIKQEILTGIGENKALSQMQKTEATDIKGGLFDIKETQTIDMSSQNVTKAAEVIDIKSHTKSVYSLPEPLPRVFDRMVVMIKNGEQTGRLIIQPPELGKIDIDLTIKSGHIQANLNAENLVVKEIIEANLNQLKQQLTDQGLIVEQFSVSVGSQNRQFREDNGQAGKSGRSGLSGVDDASAAMDQETASSIMGNRYRIDVRV
jgi:flagellar hook-length control protein FliK